MQIVKGGRVEVDARCLLRNRRRCRTPRGWRLGSFTAFHLHRVATRAIDFEHDRALLVHAVDPASLVGIKPQRIGLRVRSLSTPPNVERGRGDGPVASDGDRCAATA